MRRILALVLPLALACAHGAAAPATSSEAPSGTSAHRAGESGTTFASPYGTDPRGRAIRGEAADAGFVRTVSDACAQSGLSLDGRLGEVAENVARTSHGASRAPSYATVSHYARLSGIVEPTPEVWLASGPDTRELADALVGAIQQAARSNRLNQCGAAAIRDAGLLVVALTMSGRFVTLAHEIPQRIDPGDVVRLTGALAAGYAKPSLAVTAPDGKVTRTSLPSGRKLSHELRLRERGEHTVELLGEGPSGVSVLAMFKVAVGVEPPADAPANDDGPGEATADEVAARLAELVARERKKRGLSPLALDARVAAVARAHSEDMVAHQFIAHTSKTTGSATDRVRRAGLHATLVLENIGRGYSAREIHEGLMESPGHRANILHADPRELGVGVVAEREGERLAFIATELYTKLAGEVNPRTASKDVTDEIARRRLAAKVPRAAVDVGLSQIAQRAAERFARGEERREQALLDDASRQVQKPPSGVRAVVAALVLADDLADVWSSPRLLAPTVRALGVGIAKLDDSQAHQFAAVLLLGLSE